jgi:hypothetical protein
VKEKHPKGTPKTLVLLTWVHKHNGGKNLEGDQEAHNLFGKKNDEKPEIELKQVQ